MKGFSLKKTHSLARNNSSQVAVLARQPKKSVLSANRVCQDLHCGFEEELAHELDFEKMNRIHRAKMGKQYSREKDSISKSWR
jgi:hypothetical protein